MSTRVTNILNIDQIFEYIDVPHLILASDKFGTQYLCLLYDDDPVCRYTAIRISDERLDEYCCGQIDLRTVFNEPEYENQYFEVVNSNGKLELNPQVQSSISEDKLPDKGYYADNDNRNMIVKIPAKDVSFFNRLIRSHGWAASLL